MFRLNIQAGPGWKRMRKLCHSELEAQAAQRKFEKKVYTHGGAGAAVTQEQSVVMARWLQTFSLAELDGIISAAIRRKALGHITVSELAERYSEACRARSAGDLHRADVRYRLGEFKKKFDGTLIADVRGGDIEDWLDGLKLASETKKNHLKIVRAMFTYAVNHEWLEANPTARVAKPKGSEKAPGILSVDQMTKLLIYGDKTTRWFLVLGGFLGLRTSEALRITAENFNLEDGHAAVLHTKTSAKGIRDRYVDLLEPGRAWIEFLGLPARGRVLPYTGRTLRWHVAAALEAAETQWVHNGLRHSFCSYHLAAYSDSAKTAALAGHTSPRTTFAEYFRLATRKEGLGWFGLTPEVIKQKAAEAAARSLRV